MLQVLAEGDVTEEIVNLVHWLLLVDDDDDDHDRYENHLLDYDQGVEVEVMEYLVEKVILTL